VDKPDALCEWGQINPVAEAWVTSGSAKPAGEAASMTTAIAQAIEEMRRSGVALHRLAKDAGVAPANVIKIRNGLFHVQPGESDKSITGKASTLTRLTLYVNQWLEGEKKDPLPIETVFTDYGIDIMAPEVGRTISTVQGQAGEHRHADDPVLRQIALRQNLVSIGILKWSPFYLDSDSSVAASWAGDYSRRLVGSINPTAWQIGELQPIADIDAAVTALGSGSSSLDGIFGVYETVTKRLKGLRFVTLPGIAMPLSFVSIGGSVTWEKITRPDGQFRKEMQAIVLAGEIGDLFLLGPCQYDQEKNLIRQTSLDLKEMVKVFIGLLGRQPGAPILFCADRSMCRDFLEMTRRVPVADESVLKALKNLRLSDPNPIAPKYRLGMAVRADAQVWLELLQYSQDSELFCNAVELTADRYADLLTRAVARLGKDGAPSADIELIPLTPYMPPHLAKEFVDRCWDLLSDETKDVYEGKFEHWGRPASSKGKQGEGD
jgi:hypothetical protein